MILRLQGERSLNTVWRGVISFALPGIIASLFVGSPFARGDDGLSPLSLNSFRQISYDDDDADEPDESEAGTPSSSEIVTTAADILSTAASDADDLAKEVRELRKRLESLETAEKKRLSTEAKKSPAASAPSEKSGEKKADSGWIDLSNEKWTVKLGGHVQLDYVNWASSDPAIVGDQDYFEFRRLRLAADGTGYGVYDFRLQLTLEPEAVSDSSTVTNPAVKDAYFSINEIPWLGRVRIGNFFVPFSLEQVTNDTNNIFMERSIPTGGIFAADREVGLASYNASDDQNFSWATGVFFDNITDSLKQRIDDNQGLRVSGRVSWLPYYDEPSNGRYLLYTGAGVLYTRDQDHSVRFRARPQIHLGPRLIDTGAMSADDYTTGNLEFATVWGQFSVQSETFLSIVNLTNGDNLAVNGSYVYCSYFLTEENRIFERFGQHGAQFSRNVPHENVFWVPGCRGLGAWEAKARWSYLDFSDASKGQYNDFTVGMNWYWSDRTRVMFDWIHPITSAGSTFGATDSNVMAMRFDFNW